MTLLPAPFLTGLGLGGSLIVAIGAQNLFVLRQGLRREHVWAVVLPCILIDVTLMCLGVGGLAVSLAGRPAIASALTLGGAAVLLAYGATALWRARGSASLHAGKTGDPPTALKVIGAALAISLFNPHVYLDTVLLVGTVGASQPAGTQWLFLLGSSTASVIWFTLLGYGAAAFAPQFARPLTWRILDLITGITLCALGLTLGRDWLLAR